METMIHCPACKARLNVPAKAAGHSVRCPHCKQPFSVPTDREMVEDTITCWLEMEEEHEQAMEQKQQEEMRSPLEELPEYLPPVESMLLEEPAAQEAIPEPAHSEAAMVGAAATSSGTDLADDLLEPLERIMGIEDEGSATAVEEQLAEEPDPLSPPIVTSRQPLPERSSPPSPRPRERTSSGESEPRLLVLEVQPGGVRLGFAAHWLSLPAFRAAMPMACIACGRAEQSRLVAKPLVWSDRLDRRGQTAEEIEAIRTVAVKPHLTVRDVVAGMAEIEGMHKPFCHPVPYYVCDACAGRVHIHSHTTPMADGVMCEVDVPNATYALAWVGRVNGVCGREYGELESTVGQNSKDDAWHALPDQVRQRISGWFDYAAGERFRVYIKDSDYPKSDAGLGGLVLTTKRLVFCKYHRHGSMKLDEADTRLTAIRNGPFDDLICVREGTKAKIVRLRPDDTTLLTQLLKEGNHAVKVERGDPA